MRVTEVLLCFPNVHTMSDFIIRNQISAIEVDSRDVTVRGNISDTMIKEAIDHFDAAQVKGSLESGIESDELELSEIDNRTLISIKAILSKVLRSSF